MDNKKLFEAALTGNVELLQKLLQEHPFMLFDFELESPSESLLHVAIKAGQLNFVRELIKRKPGLSTELDKDGLRPMDIASFTGNVEILKELIMINSSYRNICRLRGKDRRTALHYAAMKGRVEVIDELVSTCPECIEDVTICGETALHLAVQNNQFEAFSGMVKWLERLSLEVVINFGDCDGNTVLHLAASRKQHQTIELLVSKNNVISAILEVNATNSKGLTAMDVLDIVMESPTDIKLQEILGRARGLRAQDLSTIPSSPVPFQQVQKIKRTHHEDQSKTFKDWFTYFKFQLQRDSPSDTRNALLVVAALIATVTFQVGVNPPTGLLEATTETSSSDNGNARSPVVTSGLGAASAILGSHATSYLFLFSNTLGLTASLSIIIYLTGGFPFQRELLISINSMMFAYGFSVSSITEKHPITYLITGIAFVLPFSIRWLPLWAKKAWKWLRQMQY